MMTPERFAALADAYGGNLDRWPESERSAAQAHLDASWEAQRVVRDAAVLDAALGSWTVQRPGFALAARIAASVSRRQSHLRRLRIWLSGLGAAATLAGGIAAGAAFVSLSAPASDPGIGQLYEVSVLGAPLSLDQSSPNDGNP